jgi:L-malate glycosyltransferase
MRIAFIIDSFLHDRAGTERQLSLLVRDLSRRADVHVVVLRQSDWLFENAAALGVTARFFPFGGLRSPRSLAGPLQLWRYLKQISADLVHTFMPVSNIVGVLAGRAAGVPVVIASRRDYGEWMSARYLAATRFANRFADHIVTNSARVKQLTVAKEGVRGDKISVIVNGMNAAALRDLPRATELRATLGVPDGARIVGLVANFRPMKRHETALLAARALAASHPETYFLLIGTNSVPYDLRGETEKRAVALGVADRVYFVGAITDVRPYLGLMDVGINCSEGEGLSNAVMEYMAAGIPCVVTNSGGNPDLIEHGVSGLLCELDDADDLAAKIATLLDDRGLAASLAARARARATAEFDLATMADRFHDLYGDLLDKRGRAGSRSRPAGGQTE